MFIALLVHCSLETKVCNPIAHQLIFKKEEACYQVLAEGIKYYEGKGEVVPFYKCISLGKENDKST